MGKMKYRRQYSFADVSRIAFGGNNRVRTHVQNVLKSPAGNMWKPRKLAQIEVFHFKSVQFSWALINFSAFVLHILIIFTL